MITVLLHGCNGRMGQIITETAAQDPQIRIGAGVDAFTGRENAYPVFPTLEACTVPCDVIIDFSNAKAADHLIAYAADKKLPLVLCTTGLSEAQLSAVNEAAARTPILRSANMSLGVNLLLKLVAEASRVLYPAGFDIEIVEKHHNQKLDAPSGTALALADAANSAVSDQLNYVTSRSDVRKKRDKAEIGISSVRGGSIVGEHDVIFAGPDEVITIEHEAFSRAIFAKGAIAAAKFLAGKPAGRYEMKDIF